MKAASGLLTREDSSFSLGPCSPFSTWKIPPRLPKPNSQSAFPGVPLQTLPVRARGTSPHYTNPLFPCLLMLSLVRLCTFREKRSCPIYFMSPRPGITIGLMRRRKKKKANTQEHLLHVSHCSQWFTYSHSFIFTAILGGSFYHSTHFANDKTEIFKD